MRNWSAGALVTIVALAWSGGATAHVGHHEAAADCCYEIAYDQYELVSVAYYVLSPGWRAGEQGLYHAAMSAHVRLLATAVTSADYVHFVEVAGAQAAKLDEDDGRQQRTPAPNPNAQPGPWEDAPECDPTARGNQLTYPKTSAYALDLGTKAATIRIDRMRKRTEVVLGPPVRGWKFACAPHFRTVRDQHGGSGDEHEGTWPIAQFNSMTFASPAARTLPLVSSNGKTAVCHVAGYQRVELAGGDEVYQFKGTYSAAIRIRKVPSGARNDEVRKLKKLASKPPIWLPGLYVPPSSDTDVGPLNLNVPPTGCSRA